MLFTLLRLHRLASLASDRADQRAVELLPGVRYRVTLALEAVRRRIPGIGGQPATAADVGNWLMRVGLTPTTRPNVWKAQAAYLRRVPQEAILNAEKL